LAATGDGPLIGDECRDLRVREVGYVLLARIEETRELVGHHAVVEQTMHTVLPMRSHRAHNPSHIGARQ